VKAGGIGTLAAGLVFAGLRRLEAYLPTAWVGIDFAALDGQEALLGWLTSWAIAAISGGLFGITYRYIIRRDRNPHLGSGAVLAFGLVRGLATIDTGSLTARSFGALGVAGVESLVLFAIARQLLDWALHSGWVQRFPAAEAPAMDAHPSG
jgi:hypothetical protein